MSTVIKVENLSKKYIIGHQHKERYQTLRDELVNGVKNTFKTPFQWMKGGTSKTITKEEFWALNNVSFEINDGDRVGIIGRNGAGKSTLLKVLSRITEPTKGRIKIKGRVASLLEVGTGFHPELTGRENIFLNGAILGMNRREIKEKFDEIVTFADVERFLDTPVKRYSSGMHVRLAFSVAAHLEPEILIVDEVLAVGDAQFQKKCMGKMEDIGKKGRTVLFVSHNMALMQQLCSNGILLSEGAVHTMGSIDNVIESYISESIYADNSNIGNLPRSSHEHGVIARFVNAMPVNIKGERVESFLAGEEVAFKLEINAFEKVDCISVVAGVDTVMGYRITTVLSEEDEVLFSAAKNAAITVNLKFPNLRLKPGLYSLTLGIRRHKVALDHVVKAINFEVSEISMDHTHRNIVMPGDILTDAVWKLT